MYRKDKFRPIFFNYLIIYLTDFYTSCIDMCEITYLKLTFTKYPAQHTNYIIPHCTT